jgi:hypothetical protein
MGITRTERLRRTAAALLIVQLGRLLHGPLTVSALRRRIYNRYGLESRALVLPEWEGHLSRNLASDTAVIEYNPALPIGRQIRVIIHELVEYLQVRDQGAFFDGMPGFASGYTGGDCPLDARHDIARRVEDHFAEALELDRGPSSFTAGAMLRILQGPGVPDRYTYDGGRLDPVRVDALDEACI